MLFWKEHSQFEIILCTALQEFEHCSESKTMFFIQYPFNSNLCEKAPPMPNAPTRVTHFYRREKQNMTAKKINTKTSKRVFFFFAQNLKASSQTAKPKEHFNDHSGHNRNIHTAHWKSQIQKRLLFVSLFAATHIQVIHNTHTLHPQQQTKDSMWLLSLYSKSSREPYVTPVGKEKKKKAKTTGNPATRIPSLSREGSCAGRGS